MKRNLIRYHESIASEFNLLENRVRDLIGSAHWLTDGEHKEAVLRRILKNHIAESFRIGKGFICYPEYPWNTRTNEKVTSTQIDILITEYSKPTLFKDGELVIVTPDAVSCIIEVKTSLANLNLNKVLDKIASEKERIMNYYDETNSTRNLNVGLFVYDGSLIDPKRFLKELKKVARNKIERAVNWIAIGPNDFIRFWGDGHNQVSSPVNGPVWHYYKIEKLAYSYFLHNIVIEHSLDTPIESGYAWFPIEGTKESFRKWYIALNDNDAHEFNPNH